MTPLVSIIIPSYNHEKFIGEAVYSCLRQTYQHIEVIIIDDGSQDGTISLLNEIAGANSNITLIQQQNHGAHHAINRGIAMAQGDYIAILNSDDAFKPTRIEKLVNAANLFMEHATDQLFFSDIEMIDEDGNHLIDNERYYFYNDLLHKTAHLDVNDALLIGNVAMTTSNFFFHRRLYENIGPFSPLRYCHDWEWALRVIIKNKCIWLHESLLSYRVHAGNTITEGSEWKHIQENSYIFCNFIHENARSSIYENNLNSPDKQFSYLLQNNSFMPVPVLIFLTCLLIGIRKEKLLAKISAGDIQEMLEKILQKSTAPFEAMLSVKIIKEQQQLIVERWQTIQQMEAMIRQRDDAAAAQGRLLEERWQTIQQMEAMIRQRDDALAAQGGLLEERLQSMQNMDAMIQQRDDAVAAQGRLLEERWQAMQDMEALIRQRDETIQIQSRLLQQRWNISNLAAKLQSRTRSALKKISDRLRSGY